MHILVERNDEIKNEILVEEVNGKKEKKYILEGICIQAEVKNRNGRVYPKKLIKPEIDRFINEDIRLGRAVGHLNHPPKDPRNDYKEVSHKFTNLYEDGNNWIGRAVVTKGTPNGAIVAGLMDEGVNMGISTRALGKTKLFEERGSKTAVVQTFRLISPGDIVSDPSAPDAYLTGLMENKEWVWQDGLLVEREVEVKEEINEAARTGKLNPEKMVELFEKFVAMTSKSSTLTEAVAPKKMNVDKANARGVGPYHMFKNGEYVSSHRGYDSTIELAKKDGRWVYNDSGDLVFDGKKVIK